MKKTILSLSLFLAVGFAAMRVNAQVSIGISIHTAPPVIPVYEQPPCPVDGFIWIPGYWAYGDEGYYWVPGYWEEPPQAGFYWTPGYWGFVGGVYRWNGGYWGPHVGYYGGINYGCGYGGSGYYGGEWYGGHFRYNTAVTRVNTTVVRNVYINRTVVRNVTVNRVSYNGGPGGVSYRANAREQAAMRDRHIERTAEQQQHQQTAMHDRNQFASVNHGRPFQPAVARPAVYHPSAATGGGRPASNAGRPAPANAGRPFNPAMNRPAPNNNNAARPAPTMNRPTPNNNAGRPAPANAGRPFNPAMNRPAPNNNNAARPAPQMNRPQPQQQNRPQPQMNRPQQQNRPQPQMNRPQPQRPQPQPHGGGGEHGGEHHR